MVRGSRRTPRHLAALLAGALALILLGGCSLKHPVTNRCTARSCSSPNAAPAIRLPTPGRRARGGRIWTTPSPRTAPTATRAARSRAWSPYWIDNPNPQGVMPAKSLQRPGRPGRGRLCGRGRGDPRSRHRRARAGREPSRGTTPAAGKSVFTGIGGCSSCHTLAAAGATGTVGPNLDTRLKSDCATAGLEEGPRGDLAEMHRHRDHQALRVHPEWLQQPGSCPRTSPRSSNRARSRRS